MQWQKIRRQHYDAYTTRNLTHPMTTATPTIPLIRRLTKSYLRPHRKILAFAVFLMILDAAATGSMAKLMEPIIDDVFNKHDRTALFWVPALVLLAFTVRGWAAYGHNVLMNSIGQRIVGAIQLSMFGHLLKADLSYFHTTPSGKLISRMTNDVNVMRYAVAEALTGIGRNVLALVFLVSLMFYQDWVLALSTFAVFPLAGFFISKTGKKIRRISSIGQEENAKLSSTLNQIFHCIRYVKAYGMEGAEETRVSSLIDRIFHVVHKSVRIASRLTPLTDILSGVAIGTLIIYGGIQVMEGRSTTGALFSFITAFIMAYEPMKQLTKLSTKVQAGLAAAEAVFKIIDERPKLMDAPNAAPLVVKNFDIKLQHVNFSYIPGDEVLHDVSMDIKEGAKVAIVGQSGAGKSTILNLIPRFYDVDSGAITIDGFDIRKVTIESLRSKIALVAQETGLFDDTIEANIAYGKPGALQSEIIAAAKSAAAHDFIMAMPNGYETMIGELGVKLSGGQRQRISIARAMLRNAPILLLDEATSALDNESERLIQEALQVLQKGRTTLVIAHRLSTVIDADCIYVMERGRVVESGTHEELLALNGTYAKLYSKELAE